MTEATQTIDTSGISRTSDGTIVDNQTTQTDQLTTNTTQDSTSTATAEGSLLNAKEKPAETKPEEKKPDSKAPEAYTDYKLPEGLKLEASIKTEVDALFKGMGLSQDQAQSLVDFYSKQVTSAAEEPRKAYQEMTDGWRKDAMDHPDLRGKLGAGQEVNVRISKLLDSVGDTKLTTDFRELMDLTGAGNHPAFIRVLDWAAKRLTEGTHVAGKGPSTHGQSDGAKAPPSAAAAMWPTLPSAGGR